MQTIEAKENFKTKLEKMTFNFFPAFRATGAKITFISSDYSTICMDLPLKLRTKNYVGTMYGGSMFSAVDGIYMVMLIKLLGKNYIVWDKEGKIRFKKPGRSKLKAVFKLDLEEITQIKQHLEEEKKLERWYSVDLIDKDGDVCATVDKLIYMKLK